MSGCRSPAAPGGEHARARRRDSRSFRGSRLRSPARAPALAPAWRLRVGGGPAWLGLLHLLMLGEHVFDRALHVECALRNGVVLPFGDLAESANRIGQLHVLAGEAGELLSDVERLRKEALDLAGARNRQLVLVRQLVDTQNR